MSDTDYQAKADEALAQLANATSDAERSRLKRAHGAYLKLVSHGAEAAARAQVRPERIKPEKAAAAPQRSESYFQDLKASRRSGPLTRGGSKRSG